MSNPPQFDNKLWASIFGTIFAGVIAYLTYAEVLPAWAFVICFGLLAFVVFPDRAAQFFKESVAWIKTWRN